MNLPAYREQLRAKGVLHWISAALLIALGTYVGDWIGASPRWVDLRYRVYQYQTKGIRPKSYAERTVLVLIGDDEYWRGEFSRRSPIKRDRLANLLRILDSNDPAVIAVDFDLRSPSPTGEPRENSDYVQETETLLEAVRDISHKRPVVIPKTLGLSNGEYFSESDIVDDFDFKGGNVRRGYIILPYDKREVPLTLPVKCIGQLDSFAQAIVKADNKKVPGSIGKPSYSLPFGAFMEPDNFTVIQAKDVLNGVQASLNELPHKIAILGADWSRLAAGRGGKFDSFLTPAGTIGGAFLHANYVEALIGQHVYQPLAPWTSRTLDIAFASILALSFALDISIWWKVAATVLISLGLVALSYVFLQNLGSFFDFLVPSVLVIFHAGFEQVREWRLAYVKKEAGL